MYFFKLVKNTESAIYSLSNFLIAPRKQTFLVQI